MNKLAFKVDSIGFVKFKLDDTGVGVVKFICLDANEDEIYFDCNVCGKEGLPDLYNYTVHLWCDEKGLCNDRDLSIVDTKYLEKSLKEHRDYSAMVIDRYKKFIGGKP